MAEDHAAWMARSRRRKNRAEAPIVPDAAFTSYYGKPAINQPTWKPADIAGSLFLGGLAGAGSAIAAGAQPTGRPVLSRTLKCGSAAAAGVALLAGSAVTRFAVCYAGLNSAADPWYTVVPQRQRLQARRSGELTSKRAPRVPSPVLGLAKCIVQRYIRCRRAGSAISCQRPAKACG